MTLLNQETIDPTGKKLYVSGATPQDVNTAITAASLAPVSPINIPTPTPDTTNYNNVYGGTNAVLTANAANVLQPKPEATSEDVLTKMLGISAPSTESIYNTDYNSSGITDAQKTLNTDTAAYNSATDKYNALNAQLKQYEYNASTLIPSAMQEQSTGRGVTAAGLAPIQAAELRKNALAAAPVQFNAMIAQSEQAAALGKAQLSQSILQQAQNHLDTIFKIHSDDAQAQYAQKTNNLNAIYSYLSSKEKTKADELATKASQDFTMKQNSIKNAQDLAKTAIANGQSDIASQISALDPNSPTYSQDIARLQGQIVDKSAAFDTQLKQLQIQKARQDLADGGEVPTVKTINGVDMQWNPTTKQWDTIGVTGAADKTQNAISQLNFLRDTAKTASSLSNAAGPSAITRGLGDIFVGDTKFRQLEAQTNTLRTNVLSLMTDPAIKKFFGPQMSDADVRLMTAAGTTLNPQNMTPDQMKTEIKRLDDLFIRMQNALDVGTRAEASGASIVTAPDGTQIQIID